MDNFPAEQFCKAYKMGMLKILVGKEPPGWHLSVSHPHRYPSWDEIKHLRYELCPDELTMALILPPKGEYVNVHPNCFHLHEIPGEGALIVRP